MKHEIAIDTCSGSVFLWLSWVFAGIKAKVDYILSFNAKHFRKVYPSISSKIPVP